MHTRYRQAGGEDRVFELEGAILEANGHAVARLDWSNDDLDERNPLALAAQTVWSRAGRAAVEAAARAHRADVVHVHNTLPRLSPAAYYGARAAGAAVVQTVHNYRLVCPGATLYRADAPCEACVGRRFAAAGVRHGCYRGSRAATLAVATMTAAHHALGTWHRAVDRYIALTPFNRDMLVRGGYPAERIAVKLNALAARPAVAPGGGGYGLFASRLDVGKGVEKLIETWEAHPDLPPLVVAGGGPLAGLVEAAAARLGPRVRFAGWLETDALEALRERADFFVFPSTWYEGGTPVALIESLGRGLPIVAFGGPSVDSLVSDGVEGRVVASGDTRAFAAAVRDVAHAAPARRAALRAGARATFERNHTPEATLAGLRRIYADAVATRHAHA